MPLNRKPFQDVYPHLASACWGFADPKHPASDQELAESVYAHLSPRGRLRALTDLIDDAHRFLEVVEVEFDSLSEAAGRTFESHHEAHNFLVDALLIWRAQLEQLQGEDLPEDPPHACGR